VIGESRAQQVGIRLQHVDRARVVCCQQKLSGCH